MKEQIMVRFLKVTPKQYEKMQTSLGRFFEKAADHGYPTKSSIACELEITPQAVSKWKVCPSHLAATLESMVDGEINRHQLRPDVHPN